MHLNEVLKPCMVWPNLCATTKEEVIKELARNIAECDSSLKCEEITAILLEREQLGSTGIQDGIAIPHGKVSGLKNILIACGRSLPGIDFDAHDTKRTHLFFVLLAPEFAAGQHLKVLARISRLLKDSLFRERLMSAADEKEIYKIITEEDEKL